MKRAAHLDVAPHVGIGRPTAFARSVVARWLWPLVRLMYRPTIDGLEQLPRDRPFLLVTTHSGGMGLAEILCFTALYLRECDAEPPIAGFAHPFGFRIWPLTKIHRHIGAVPSTYAWAERALGEGVSLLVFPGGDHEALRPAWQADRVDFAGRMGFVRIAARAGVPIVPMGIRGGAWTCPIVWRSKLLSWLLIVPRLMHLKRWGVSAHAAVVTALIWLSPLPWWGALLATWAWLCSALAFLPIVPATVRFRVGEPIEPPDRDASDEELRARQQEIAASVQALVSSLARR